MARLFSGFERRASPENPDTPLTSAALLDIFGGADTDAGVSVSPLRAMGFTPVWRAVRLISETLSTLPLKVHRRTDGGREDARDHPMWELLHDRPNTEQTSQLWREMLQAHLLLWGNAYCEIQRTEDRSRVIGLWPLLPDRTSVKRLGLRKIYTTTIPEGDGVSQVSLAAEDVLHIPGLGFDGLRGYSPLTLFREAIGLGIAMETYTAKWYGSGAHIGGFLEHPEELGDEAYRRIKSQIEQRRGLDQAHRLLFLEEGMKYKSLGETPEHSQLKDSRIFQVQDVGRIFGVPPHQLYDTDRAFQSNVEDMGIEFVQYTLRGWLVRWEQVYNWSLFTPAERRTLYAEHEVDGLLRGNFKARMEGYEIARRQGLITPADVARRENWAPPADDRYATSYLVQQNQVMITAGGEIVPLNSPTGSAPPSREAGGAAFRSRLHEAFHDVVHAATARFVNGVVGSVRRAIAEHSPAEGEEPAALVAWTGEYFGESTESFFRDALLAPMAAFMAAVAREALVEVGAEVQADVLDREIRGRCCREILSAQSVQRVMELRAAAAKALRDEGIPGLEATVAGWEDQLPGALARDLVSRAGAAAAARALTLCENTSGPRMLAVI